VQVAKGKIAVRCTSPREELFAPSRFQNDVELRWRRSMMFQDQAKREGMMYTMLLVAGLTLTGWGLHHLIRNSDDEIAKTTNVVSSGQATHP
jgi:hypothetical protein